MFWQFNHQSSAQMETVLAKEDLTLSEILNQENILQELKSPNTKLIEFITRSDILDELISLIIEEPSKELDEQERYKMSNIACEVLTTDLPRLNESLSDLSLLTKLYSFLEQDPPLNPLLASFFSRTLSLLICRKSDQNWYSYQFTCLSVLDFLKSKGDSLTLLLKHLGTSAIMDLTLKLITQVEGEGMQRNLVDWLASEKLIENLIDLFHPSVESDRHNNAAQLLCDTIKKFGESDSTIKETSNPESILNTIQSVETIQKLLRTMLESEPICESTVIGGISVLLALLEPPSVDNGRRHPYSNDDSNANAADVNKVPSPAVSSIILTIIPFLPKLHDLLINPPKKPPLRLTCGVIDPPLGNTRLTVIMLISALISTNTPEVNEKLDELNTIQVILDLFLRYMWNNFLHSQVEKSFVSIMNCANVDSNEKNPLLSSLFVKCRLLQRIMEAWEENKNEQSNGGKRKGYMGHLINISNAIVTGESGKLGQFLKDHVDEEIIQKWKEFVVESLTPVNEVQLCFLGGSHPSHTPPKDECEFSDPFNAEDVLEKNDWLKASKELTDAFPLSKIDGEDDLSIPRDEERRMLFEQMCSNRKLSAGMDDLNAKDNWESQDNNLDITLEEEEIEDWEDYPMSSDEDDEKPGKKKIGNMWSGTITDSNDPWSKVESENGNNSDGWANFDRAFSEQCSTLNNSVDIEIETPPTTTGGEEPVTQVKPLEESSASVDKSEDPVSEVHNDVQAVPQIQSSEEKSHQEVKNEDAKHPVEDQNSTVGDIPIELDAESDNNANIKSLTSEEPNEELYFRICTTKNKANERSDEVPKIVENTQITNPSDNSSAVTREEIAKTAAPPDPV